jgi:hypothetical protein
MVIEDGSTGLICVKGLIEEVGRGGREDVGTLKLIILFGVDILLTVDGLGVLLN